MAILLCIACLPPDTSRFSTVHYSIHIFTAWGWFDASRTGGVGGRSRPTCTALSRAWKDACGLTAVVSSWYGNDASILKAIASPVISDQQLRRCLVAPGEDACMAAAMWPTFYTHTLQSCPEGWTMTAMGVCLCICLK